MYVIVKKVLYVINVLSAKYKRKIMKTNPGVFRIKIKSKQHIFKADYI